MKTKIISAALAAALLTGVGMCVSAQQDNLLAFPGAEGGGKYTEGARADGKQTVYHVTSLAEEGSGTFADAVSSPNRIIVFDVGGTINISSKIKITAPNLTILGQTAPGDGITIAGSDVELAADNLIIRYLRIRPGDSNGGEPDGLGGRWINNVIVDHCSVSWGVDELLTLYSGSLENSSDPDTPKTQSSNITVQYCIASESLKMSNHIKGAHGYGGISGATLGTWHHNLYAHNDSRNPRLDRNLKSTELVNNVVYDAGNNVCYGGEPYSYHKWEQYSTPEWVSNVNLINCFYKYGPSTMCIDGKNIRNKIFEATNDGTVEYDGETLKSNFYIEGNYVWGSPETTADNWLSEDTVQNQALMNRLTEPVDMGEYATEKQSAQEAYENVIANAGATLPRRDCIDARVAADVKNGTGRIINSAKEVGGFTAVEESSRVFAIPDDWKSENGMGNASETDIVKSGEMKGYTWIEAYVNDMTAEESAPTNPEITVNSPAVATTDLTSDKTGQTGFWKVITEGEALTYSMSAAPVGDTKIVSTALYDGETLLGKYDGNKLEAEPMLDAGVHYLTSRAWNDKGESTSSPTSIVYVKGTQTEDYAEAQIGKTAFDNMGGAWYDEESGVYTVGGSGTIGSDEDSCDFMYKKVCGDFTFKAKTCEIPKYENGVVSGIMIRDGLDSGAREIMLGDGWLKNGENISVITRTTANASAERGFMLTSDGKTVDNNRTLTDEEKAAFPISDKLYLVAKRSGDKLTVAVSEDGEDLTSNVRCPMEIDISGWGDELYVGLATDSAQSSTMLPYYSIASFSNVELSCDKTDEVSGLLAVNGKSVNAQAYVPSDITAESIAYIAMYDEKGMLTAVTSAADAHDAELACTAKDGDVRAQLVIWETGVEELFSLDTHM